MPKSVFFDRNLLALSEKNPELSSRIRKAETNNARYKFLESRNGELIPAWIDPLGAAHPLHSMMDPRKEAKRLIGTVEKDSFLILLGMGGGYYAEAALERDDIGMVLVIEYDLSSLAELFCEIDFSRFFADIRFRLFADLPEKELKEIILDLYQPALYGGIRVIPMRSRTDQDSKPFIMATEAIQAAIGHVSADFSVQAHFGRRWFSNIVRNLKSAETTDNCFPQINRAAVTAAGPSLSMQIPNLRKKRKTFFLIATDTSLPCLLQEDLIPDAVISIDCQHISYYHFMNGLPKEVLLFLDLASPPLLSGLSNKSRFFSTGHPLTRYISRTWKAMPLLDASGGNVTYAAVSLAEELGAGEIELYGADFSYPHGVSYARGAYIYSFFEKSQNRLSPLESQASAFLYRTPLSKKSCSNNSWYYETDTLKFYREKLEGKSGMMEAVIIPEPGLGAPVNAGLKVCGPSVPRQDGNPQQAPKNIPEGKAAIKAEEFLRFYRNEIARLPKPGNNTAAYLASLENEQRPVFTTILPIAAALKQCRPELHGGELFEAAKAYILKALP